MVVEVHFLAKKGPKVKYPYYRVHDQGDNTFYQRDQLCHHLRSFGDCLASHHPRSHTIFFLFSIALLPMTPFPYKYFNCVPQILCRVITKLSYMFLLVAKCYLLILSLVNSGLSPRTLIYRDCRRHSHFPDFLKQLPSHCFSALLERQLRHKQPNQSLTTPHLCCLDTGHAPK